MEGKTPKIPLLRRGAALLTYADDEACASRGGQGFVAGRGISLGTFEGDDHAVHAGEGLDGLGELVGQRGAGVVGAAVEGEHGVRPAGGGAGG